MCLISVNLIDCSGYINAPIELCKALRNAHLAAFFEFYTGLSAAFSAESEETEATFWKRIAHLS